jgi:hypothetical protein
MSGGGGHHALLRPPGSAENCAGCDALAVRVANLEARVRQLEAACPVIRPAQVVSRCDKWQPSDSTPLLREYFGCRRNEWKKSRGKCRLVFVQGDLVTAQEDYKLHFVSGDMKRSKGVALELANVFGPIEKTMHYDIGQIEVQEKGSSALLNVVSKRRLFHRMSANPERFLVGFVAALNSARDFCKERRLQRLAMVRLGAGLDRVNWKWTQQKILEIFEDLDITLAVYVRPRRGGSQHVSLQEQSTPDLGDEGHFPLLGGRGRRTVGAERQLSDLRPGRLVDACGGLDQVRRPGAPNKPSARPEASADDGRRASTSPRVAQVSPDPFALFDDVSPTTAVIEPDARPLSVPPVMSAAGCALMTFDDLDVPVLDDRGAGVATGSQGAGASRHSLALAWEPGASTKTVSTVSGILPAVPGLAPSHLALSGEPLVLTGQSEQFILSAAGNAGAAPETFLPLSRNFDGAATDGHDRSDSSMLLLGSPKERGGARPAPPPGRPGSDF